MEHQHLFTVYNELFVAIRNLIEENTADLNLRQ